jgi:glucose/arabinose dehydrogenase
MKPINRAFSLFALGAGMLANGLALGTERIELAPFALTVTGETREVRLPSGYRLELLTRALESPRMLTFAPDGDLFIGSGSGRVYRLASPYREPQVFADAGGYPHSVAFRPGEILIAYTEGLYRAPYTPGRPPLEGGEQRLLAALPGGGGHSSRTVGVGPDGRVYVSVGISGNCPNEYLGEDYAFSVRRGGVLVLDESGAKPVWRTFASGLRNPVGFDWHPETDTLYASNNGPDHWGFDLPPEYFSRLSAGSFHGMPWFQLDGERMRRDECIRTPPPRPVSEAQRPVATFPARSAPMAVAFVPKDVVASSLAGSAVVALHGSWATRPDGRASGDPATRREPKLVLVRFDGGDTRGVEDLVTGFQLPDGSRWARPVGAAFEPDGALYFTSDSGANALFRLVPNTDPAPQGDGHGTNTP